MHTLHTHIEYQISGPSIFLLLADHKGNLQCLAFVQYGFDRKEHEIDIQPHDNSKKKGAYQQTKLSTVKLIKASVSENKRPLKVLREVENLQGGVMQAKLSCDLPRNRRQIYNFKSASKVNNIIDEQWSFSIRYTRSRVKSV